MPEKVREERYTVSKIVLRIDGHFIAKTYSNAYK